MFKKEVEHVVIIWFLEKSNDLEWGALSFAQPKPETNLVHVLSDFRHLNKQLKCKLSPMIKSNKMLLELEVFKYAISPDLNMEYYHIQITEYTSNLCTTS